MFVKPSVGTAGVKPSAPSEVSSGAGGPDPPAALGEGVPAGARPLLPGVPGSRCRGSPAPARRCEGGVAAAGGGGAAPCVF
ncbi:hypothetical protein ASZ78_007360 [Callipepla squamata]|uniref:Uncharacterized protein n=1 Tax=Callipepla squamata TaxID=9009 RepID=A0A226NBR9_CALSU|nr:hypothetical protein ASZ78_007360 [Callipepla squamata]